MMVYDIEKGYKIMDMYSDDNNFRLKARDHERL